MKKIGRKVLILALAAAVLVGMTACGGTEKKKEEKKPVKKTEQKKDDAIKTGTHETMVGTTSLKSEQIVIEPALTVKSSFDLGIAAKGSTVYTLTDGKVRQYTWKDSKMTDGKDVQLEKEYKTIELTGDGLLRLSKFMGPYIGLKNGKPAFSYDDLDYVAVHPSGKWGINYFTDGAKVTKVTFSGSTVNQKAFPLRGVHTVRRVNIDKKYIYVCGTDKDSLVFVYIYNFQGKLVKKLKDSDGSGLGSPTFMASTKKGFIALDGNMRTFDMWDKTGKWAGSAKASDLFGVDYPWISGAKLMPDGSLMVIMSQKRPEDKNKKSDQKTIEALVYKVTGFQ